MYTGNIREVVSDNARGRSPRALSVNHRGYFPVYGYLGYNQSSSRFSFASSRYHSKYSCDVTSMQNPSASVYGIALGSSSRSS